MNIDEIENLIEKYYKGSCNPEEIILVNAILDLLGSASDVSLDATEKRKILINIKIRIYQQIGILD